MTYINELLQGSRRRGYENSIISIYQVVYTSIINKTTNFPLSKTYTQIINVKVEKIRRKNSPLAHTI
jgi:hypothetical protein